MCLYTSLLDLKEWSYDTDQASYQKLFGFHFPPTHYHGSCESNPFICLKMTKPFFECMYTVKRNSDCRTMTTFVNHFWRRIMVPKEDLRFYNDLKWNLFVKFYPYKRITITGQTSGIWWVITNFSCFCHVSWTLLANHKFNCWLNKRNILFQM